MGSALCVGLQVAFESLATNATPCGLEDDFTFEVTSCKSNIASCSSMDQLVIDSEIGCLNGMPACDLSDEDSWQSQVGGCTATAALVGPMCAVIFNSGFDGGGVIDGGPFIDFDAGFQGNCAPGSVEQIEANCVCQASVDCEAGNNANWACTPGNSCLQICTGTADPTCAFPNVCEDLICRQPACGDDSECDVTEQCVAGGCQSEISSAEACVIVPTSAVLNAGGTMQFSIIVYTGDNVAAPYEGSVEWMGNGLSATTTSGSINAVFTAPSTATAESGAIWAFVPGANCQPASVFQYSSAPPNGVRVVVASGGAPLAGATVLIDAVAARQTMADGSVFYNTGTTGLATGPHTVSVFATGFNYVTVVGTNATDVLIPLNSIPNPGSYTGEVSADDFNNVSNPEGTLHLMMASASIGSDFMENNTAVPLQSVTISLGTATSYGPFNLPEGIVLGLGPTMFGPGGAFGPTEVGGDFGIVAMPGYRAFWAIGGNAVIGDVLQAIGPYLNGGASAGMQDADAFVALDPVFGSLESGVTSGLAVFPGDSEPVVYGTFGTYSLQLSTLMRLHLNVKTPILPAYTDDCGNQTMLNEEEIVGGVMVPVQGFVPLGMAYAMDTVDTEGNPNTDGITAPATPGGPEQQLSLRLAPRNGGAETAPWTYITQAFLASQQFQSSQRDGGAPCTNLLAMAETIGHNPAVLQYSGGATTPVDLSQPFLGIPSGVTISQLVRKVTMPADVTGAVYHRLDLGPGVRGTNAYEWNVYFPAGTTSVALPNIPAGFADPVEAGSIATLLSVSFGYPTPTGSTLTYDGIWQFDGNDANDLSTETDSFSLRQITIGM